jgi:hypothetical protein
MILIVVMKEMNTWDIMIVQIEGCTSFVILISLMELLRCMYRGLVLIVSVKRERCTALTFIASVKDLCITYCNTCVLVVIFLINVVYKSITVTLKIYIYILPSTTTNIINHLTPNGHFSGRTAPVTYRC